MRIISKFHDYYDTGMRYGIDKECVYIREEKVIETEVKFLEKELPDMNYTYHHRNYHFDTVIMFVGFCGQVYSCIKLLHGNLGEETVEYFYNMDMLTKYLTINKKKFKLDEWNRWHKMSEYDKVIELFDEFYKKPVPKKVHDFFQTYKTPMFVIKKKRYSGQKPEFIINAKLSPYDFFKVKNPYEAYQDIYMYISGVLGVNNREMVEISNKDMIVKKGFDTKTSFRNPVTFKQLMKGEKK